VAFGDAGAAMQWVTLIILGIAWGAALGRHLHTGRRADEAALRTHHAALERLCRVSGGDAEDGTPSGGGHLRVLTPSRPRPLPARPAATRLPVTVPLRSPPSPARALGPNAHSTFEKGATTR
jgi:hypothetical protein